MKTDYVKLPDGRRLAFSWYGNPAGRPTFYFHGCPGSRLDMEACGEAVRRPDMRIVAVDRPGTGLSDRQPQRTLLDWPRDVAALADSLGADRFHLIGVSGGAPYAAACLHAMPDRVINTALVCPLFPLAQSEAGRCMAGRHRFILHLARRSPLVLARVCAMIGWVVRHRPGLALSFMAAAASHSDRQILARPTVRAALIRSFQEAIRNTMEGILQDLFIYTRPWGFAISGLQTRVYLWQGLADRTVPPVMGRAWITQLPCFTAHFLPEEGHFSLPIDHMSEIMDAMAEYPGDAC